MTHRIRLSPVAIFLSVIAIVLSTLAVLTIATAHADRVMAQRFASVTALRYELESEGSAFLLELDRSLRDADGTLPDGLEQEGDGSYLYRIEKEGYELVITLSINQKNGSWKVTGWETKKIWSGSDPIYEIWQGAGGSGE